MNIDQRISKLRQEMNKLDLAAYIIPSSDPHQSEYVADCWKSREYISGFTGSAGLAIVTQDAAGLWTDSRYFLQAEEELSDSEFVLYKMVNQFKPIYIDWLIESLEPGSTVGIDGAMFSQSQALGLKNKLETNGLKIDTHHDLIDITWEDRPCRPKKAIFEHEIKYAGVSRKDKLRSIRNKMKEVGAKHHLVTTLDDIGWIYNIRGSDVECNPVAVAYSLISEEEARLYIDSEKISPDLKKIFEKENIKISEYDKVASDLAKFSKVEKIMVDPGACSRYLYRHIAPANVIDIDMMPSRWLKAIKNPTEIDHIRNVMEKDGVALCKLFMWLEDQLASENKVTEAGLADRLAEYRAEQEGYFGESFYAIVGYKSNGAIIHYKPEHETSAEIRSDGILLLDSGGQYLDGTTDITRTIPLSEPTESQKKAYTLVLKGYIALDRAIYPEGTIGGQLDMLARKPLWDHGMNYPHGTGHGVGFFMNVHEPPQGFTAGMSSRSNTKLVPGMITSNEPGHYVPGEYGMRIENIILTKESKHKGFLYHETLTLFPIHKGLIDSKFMTEEEIDWLDKYHQEVLNRLSPRLNDSEKQWMEEMCSPLKK